MKTRKPLPTFESHQMNEAVKINPKDFKAKYLEGLKDMYLINAGDKTTEGSTVEQLVDQITDYAVSNKGDASKALSAITDHIKSKDAKVSDDEANVLIGTVKWLLGDESSKPEWADESVNESNTFAKMEGRMIKRVDESKYDSIIEMVGDFIKSGRVKKEDVYKEIDGLIGALEPKDQINLDREDIMDELEAKYDLD